MASELTAVRAGAGGVARPRPSAHAQPSLSPPRVAQTMAVVLSCVTALALLLLALTLGNPGMVAGEPDTTAQSAVIHGFYDAVNGILAGGDPAAIDRYVAPDVVVHGADGDIDGRAALAARLRTFGATSPGLSVHLVALIVEGNRAAATVEQSASMQPAPGLRIEGPAFQPAETEQFRLVGGQIAEYWQAPDDRGTTRVLPPAPLSLWLGAKQAGLARFAFPPGAEVDDLLAPGPHLILPESGVLTVSLDGPAEIARADAVGWRPTTSAESPLTLRPGDALLVPADVVHTIRNRTAAGASMLGVLLSWRMTSPPQSSRMSPGPPTLFSMYNAGPIAERNVWDGGATIEALARSMDICAARQDSTLTVAWLRLDAGQSIAARPTVGVELLTAQSGTLLVGQSHPALATNRDSADQATGFAAPEEPAVLMTGDGVAFSTGLTGSVTNTGNAPAMALLVATGAPGESMASPPAASLTARASAPCDPGTTMVDAK